MTPPAGGVPLPLLLDDVAYLGRAVEADDFDAMAHGVGACVWLADRGELRGIAVAVYSLVAGRLDAAAAKAARKRRFPRSDPDAVDAERAAMAEEQRERRAG